MYIQQKTAAGTTLVPLESELLQHRKLLLKGDIDDQNAMELVEALWYLCRQDRETPIDLLLHSAGGEIFSNGLLLYDAMRTCGVPIRTICLGGAYSMAAVLFSAGSGGRFLLPNSRLMLHEPLVGSQVAGSTSTIRSLSENLLQTKQRLNEILSRHTGRTIQEIDAATSYDHFFSAQEAVDFGLADGIMTFADVIGEECAQWQIR